MKSHSEQLQPQGRVQSTGLLEVWFSSMECGSRRCLLSAHAQSASTLKTLLLLVAELKIDVRQRARVSLKASNNQQRIEEPGSDTKCWRQGRQECGIKSDSMGWRIPRSYIVTRWTENLRERERERIQRTNRYQPKTTTKIKLPTACPQNLN